MDAMHWDAGQCMLHNNADLQCPVLLHVGGGCVQRSVLRNVPGAVNEGAGKKDPTSATKSLCMFGESNACWKVLDWLDLQAS